MWAGPSCWRGPRREERQAGGSAGWSACDGSFEPLSPRRSFQPALAYSLLFRRGPMARVGHRFSTRVSGGFSTSRSCYFECQKWPKWRLKMGLKDQNWPLLYRLAPQKRLFFADRVLWLGRLALRPSGRQKELHLGRLVRVNGHAASPLGDRAVV